MVIFYFNKSYISKAMGTKSSLHWAKEKIGGEKMETMTNNLPEELKESREMISGHWRKPWAPITSFEKGEH